MGVEQALKRLSLGELRKKSARIFQVESKITSMIEDPGGQIWPQHLRTNNISNPEESWDNIVKVGEIAEVYKDYTLPIVKRERQRINFEFEERLRRARENMQRIEALVEKGIYPKEVLVKAEEELSTILGRDGKNEAQEKPVASISLDGLISQRNSKTDQVIELLVSAYNKGKPVAGEELARIVYGNGAPLKRAIKNLSALLTGVKQRLESNGLILKNVADQHVSRAKMRSEYSLVKIEASGQEALSNPDAPRDSKEIIITVKQIGERIGIESKCTVYARIKRAKAIDPTLNSNIHTTGGGRGGGFVMTPQTLERLIKRIKGPVTRGGRRKLSLDQSDGHRQGDVFPQDAILNEENPDEKVLISVEELGRRCGIQKLSTVRNRLARERNEDPELNALIKSTRGRNGGLLVSRKALEILVARINWPVAVRRRRDYLKREPSQNPVPEPLTPAFTSERGSVLIEGNVTDVSHGGDGSAPSPALVEEVDTLIEGNRLAKEERERKAREERTQNAKKLLRIDLTHMFLTHFAKSFKLSGLADRSIQNNPTRLLESYIPPGVSLSDLIKGNEETQSRFIVDLFIEIAKDLGRTSISIDELERGGRYLSPKEKQIVSMFANLRSMNRYSSDLIRELCNFFDIAIPVEFKGRDINGPNMLHPGQSGGQRRRGPSVDMPTGRGYKPPRAEAKRRNGNNSRRPPVYTGDRRSR